MIYLKASVSTDAGGFSAEVHLSPDLADFMGQEKMPRTEVTKRIWAYIKEHDLQDPRDKRKILCDAALEKVLKRKSIHMFTMTKVLSAVRMLSFFCAIFVLIHIKIYYIIIVVVDNNIYFMLFFLW